MLVVSGETSSPIGSRTMDPTTTTQPIPVEGTLKRTQLDHLVICVNQFYVGRHTTVGELITVVSEADGTTPLTPGRAFRVERKGELFGHFKNATQKRDGQQVYLYVTEIVPEPVVEAAPVETASPTRQLRVVQDGSIWLVQYPQRLRSLAWPYRDAMPDDVLDVVHWGTMAVRRSRDEALGWIGAEYPDATVAADDGHRCGTPSEPCTTARVTV